MCPHVLTVEGQRFPCDEPSGHEGAHSSVLLGARWWVSESEGAA